LVIKEYIFLGYCVKFLLHLMFPLHSKSFFFDCFHYLGRDTYYKISRSCITKVCEYKERKNHILKELEMPPISDTQHTALPTELRRLFDVLY